MNEIERQKLKNGQSTGKVTAEIIDIKGRTESARNMQSGGNGSVFMEFMTVKETATRLRLKESWVYTHADELGAYRLGKYLRFSWPRILECLEGKNKSLDWSSNDPIQDLDFTGCKTNREQNANNKVD
jgi:hypothetical protein